MKISVTMPLGVFEGLLDKCESWRGEREILNNAVVLEDAEHGSAVEFICELEQARLLLDLATRVYPDAVPYVEDSISLANVK